MQNQVIGHLGSYQLGGFSVASEYAALQPQRDLSPGNSQVFVLSNSADLDIYVNGFVVSRIRLRAGRYDLKDLPLTSGSNNIRIVAQYIDGQFEEFTFSTHYNAQLLAQGMRTYQLLLGAPSEVNNRVYHYQDTPALVGSVEQGLTNKLTVGVNGLWHQQGKLFGVTATSGQSWGNASWRFSASEYQQVNGYAMTLEAEHNVVGQSQYGAPNLRWGVERRQDFVATPWLGGASSQNNTSQIAQSNERYFVDYHYYVSDELDFGVFANVQHHRGQGTIRDVTAQLNWRYQGMNIASGVRYQDNANGIDSHDKSRFFINFTWNIYHLANNARTRFRYNSRTKVANATYTKVNSNYMGDYGYQGVMERGDDYRREQFRGSYTANWLRTDVSGENYQRNGQLSQGNLSVNMASSIAIADGKVGIGRNISAPFALVSKHQSLGDSRVLINVDRRGRAQSESSNQVAALVSLGTGYNQAQFHVDVPDAPFGYDWGPGAYSVAGGAATGHHYMVGSDLSYTVLGVLVDDKGEPLSLARGEIVALQTPSNAQQASGNQPQRYRFFTNRSGRFVVEGIGVGRYQVRYQQEGKWLSGVFELQPSEVRFVNVKQIQLKVSR